MAKRKILNRRSSRSSRYTGSGILDPDTDLIDNAYPCWWKDLENNTIVRPSINYSMLNETSRHLDSSSRIETSKIVNEWWKALDASNSSIDSENHIEKSAPKFRIATSESEEELQVKKRKLPLRSRAKIHQNNAFFNILNDSEDSSRKISTPDTRNKNLLTSTDSSNKTIINEEQLTNTKDSRSNQSSNLNNILKSKPKIFKKNYKDQRRSVFVDALQDNEFKAPSQKGPSINESQKLEQKNSSITMGLDNQSESTDFTSFLNSVHDFSHLPAPKAQSTTVEESTSHNSTKNSISDGEYKIVKPKPKLFRHPTKSIKKNVFENTSVDEETDKGTKTGNLENIVENIEKSKLLKRRTRSTKRNVFEDIFAAEESDIQTETSKLTNVDSIEIAKQSSIFSSNDLSKSFRELQKNVVNEDENNDTEKVITPRSKKKRKSAILGAENIKESLKDRLISENVIITNDDSDFLLTQKRYNLRKITNVDANARSESLNSLGSTIKRKNAREKSTCNQNVINDKNDENILNVTGGYENASKGFEDKEVPNELQNTNRKQENISPGRSAVDVISSFNKKERDSTINRSRSLSKTSKSASSVRKEGSINRKISNTIDKDVRDVGKKDSYINVSSGSNRNKRNETEKRSRSSRRTSNLTLSMESIGNMPIHEYTGTWNISKKNIREVESISKDSGDKEMLNKSQYVEDSDVFQKKSVSNDFLASKTKKSGNVRNSNRLSLRNSNLTSSLKKIDTSVNASKIGDKNVRDESLNHISSEETLNQLQYVDKKTSTRHRKSANVSSRNSLSSRASNLTSFTRKIDGIDTNTLNVDDNTTKDLRDDGTSDPNNKELVSKIPRLSHSRSVANVSTSSSEKESNDKGYRNRISSRSRASNLVSSKTTGDTHANNANVANKNVREVQDEVTSDSDEELANRIQRLSESSFKANSLLSFTEKRIENLNTNIIKVDDKDLKNVEDKVPSDSSDEELVHNESRLSQRKFGTNASSSFDGKERERTENRITVSPRTANLVPSVKLTRLSIKVPSVGDKDGRGTRKEESIDIGNEAISDKLRYVDKERKNVSRSPAANMSYNDNRRKRGTTENRGRSLFRTSNLISFAQNPENTGANSLNVDDKNEREVQDEEPLVNSVQRSSERFATDVSFSFNRKERSDTENHGRISSTASNPASMHRVANVNSNNSNVDGKNLMETEDEAANKLENVYKKQENVSVKKSVAIISTAFNRKTGSDIGTGDKVSGASNSMTSRIEIVQANKNASNINGIDGREAEDGISDDSGNKETSNRLHRVDKNINTFQEIFESNVSSALKTKRQTSIRSFFNFDEPAKLTAAEKEKAEKIRMELDKVKRQEMNCMNASVQQRRTQPSSTGRTNINERKKIITKSRKKRIVPEQVHKAYLVNGQVYKVPRLPRPKTWVTDRLYNYLWKLMEPKYKFETRVISEKFICRLSAVTTSIAKQKLYRNYKGELYALMKEMARLGIIRTRNDFYNFCHDFFPYELRAKLVPMLLPGNERNIPYDPNTLHKPILDS